MVFQYRGGSVLQDFQEQQLLLYVLALAESIPSAGVDHVTVESTPTSQN
tara:strand:- start:553 stop:699 length:147 start_codon:yes stop_codon:yes gene_type:complete